MHVTLYIVQILVCGDYAVGINNHSIFIYLVVVIKNASRHLDSAYAVSGLYRNFLLLVQSDCNLFRIIDSAVLKILYNRDSILKAVRGLYQLRRRIEIGVYALGLHS